MELVERLPLDKIHYLNSLTFKQYKDWNICKSSSKNDDERKIQFNNMKSLIIYSSIGSTNLLCENIICFSTSP